MGTLPATGWLAFAIVYFGAPFPNTAYAKALDNGVAASAYLRQGLAYFRNGLEWDPATPILMALGLALALVSTFSSRPAGTGSSRDRSAPPLAEGRAAAAPGPGSGASQGRSEPLVGAGGKTAASGYGSGASFTRGAPLLAASGMLLYLAYVAAVGAAGTHMSGRFFSGPFVVGALLVASLAPGSRAAMAVGSLVVALMVFSPGAPLLSAGSRRALGDRGHGRAGIIDTRWFVHRDGAALRRWHEGISWPNHGWYDEGVRFRESAEKVSVGGAGGSGLPIGYFSYAAGPEKFVIDVLGLTDPLLARLPMRRGWQWWGGHFMRDVPDGYVESVRNGDNEIVDPDLHAYYEKIRLITRGPIFGADRFRAIFELQTGALDPLVASYAARQREAPVRKAR